MIQPIKIGIYGSDKGHGTAKVMSTLLKQKAIGHILISVLRYEQIGNEMQLIIFQTSRLADIFAMRPDIILFEHTQSRHCDTDLSGLDAIAVLETDDTDAANIIADTGISAVTCGLSQKSSVTVSSITDTETVISVQRSIIDLFGNVIEPQEIKVAIGPECGHEYEAVSAATALLLSGITPQALENV